MSYLSDYLSKKFDCKVNVAVNPNAKTGFNQTEKQYKQNQKPMSKQDKHHDPNNQTYQNFGPQGGSLPPEIFYQLMKKGNFFQQNESQYSYLGLQEEPQKKFQVYKQELMIPDKRFNTQLEESITELKQMFSRGTPLFQSKKLQKIAKQNIEKLEKYFKQGYSKPGAIWLIASQYGLVKQTELEDYNKILKKQKNPLPLFSALFGRYLYKLKDQRWKQILQNAIKFRQPFAFQFLGQAYQNQEDYQKSFQMFKKTQKQGLKYSAWLHIADLYITGTDKFPSNTFRAYQYEEKVAKLINYPEEQMPQQSIYFRYPCQNLLQRADENNLLQAHILSAYLKGSLQSLKDYAKFKKDFCQRPFVQQYRQNLRSACAEPNKCVKYFQVIMKLKQPQNIFIGFCPIRQSMQIIQIQNWKQQKNRRQELSSILIEGRKVKLNYYSTDYNGLIVHVKAQYIELVEKAYKAKHQISQQNIRNYGKSLLTKGYELQSIVLYDHLIQKGRAELSILQSNKGLAYDKIGKSKQAEQCYLKSLQVYPYEKSAIRLCYLYLKAGKVEQAVQVLKKVANVQQKSLLEQKIKELRRSNN